MGGAMVSALVSESSGLGSSPGRGYCVVFLAQDTFVTQFLSIQVYKWMLASVMLGIPCNGLAFPFEGE